ncbi:hypothetical protein C8J57DRAFT_1498865 [Mycena rebaudengoi]|nr:hypothetical protein C8J57DRAFT_1498865 [Mycena rebaudengoi]
MARSLFRSRRDSSQRRSPSPTFSDATNVSAMHFGANGPEKIITRANLKASLQAYEELMKTSSHYRAALMNLSKSTAAFANAMEICSGLKGPSYEAGTRLQAASGLHHLIGNHWHVLAETLDLVQFRKAPSGSSEHVQTIMAERTASYERVLREKSQIIRDTEMRSMNKKERNLQSFREALGVLQRQVDELDDLKAAHYQEIVDHEEEVWDAVQGKICVVMRSTMDVFDKFTAKASDPVIEPMLQAIPDAFDSYGPPPSEDQIFSILAPLSIMTNSNVPSSSPSPMPTPAAELPGVDGLPASTSSPPWMPPSSSGSGSVAFPTSAAGWEDESSPSTSTPPQSISPPLANRKHLTPLNAIRHPRKSESKLRTVLSPIDETRSRGPIEDARPNSIMSSLNSSPPVETSPNHSWAFIYGNSPPGDPDDRDAKTPSYFPRSSTPPRPLQEARSDTDIQVPIAT